MACDSLFCERSILKKAVYVEIQLPIREIRENGFGGGIRSCFLIRLGFWSLPLRALIMETVQEHGETGTKI